MKAIVELKNATKVVTNGFNEERVILDKVNLTIYQGDFITILGGNGAGKSTLFNVIAGTLPLTSGSVHILGEDVTNWPAEKRAKYLARVFQDPKMGTSPRMTVAENLLIAKYRGEGRGLVPRKLLTDRGICSTLTASWKWFGKAFGNASRAFIRWSTSGIESLDGEFETTRIIVIG